MIVDYKYLVAVIQGGNKAYWNGKIYSKVEDLPKNVPGHPRKPDASKNKPKS